MFGNTPAFSGFSVDDIKVAEKFYGDTLKIKLDVQEGMGFMLLLAGGARVFVYDKQDHQPASFTVLNFEVPDIDKAVDELEALGIKMEHYDLGNGASPDPKGIMRGKAANMGPDIAWFKDPAGNVLAVLSN